MAHILLLRSTLRFPTAVAKMKPRWTRCSEILNCRSQCTPTRATCTKTQTIRCARSIKLATSTWTLRCNNLFPLSDGLQPVICSGSIASVSAPTRALQEVGTARLMTSLSWSSRSSGNAFSRYASPSTYDFRVNAVSSPSCTPELRMR
jgi:hypothetical protein